MTAESFVSASFIRHQEKISEVLRVNYTTFLDQGESIRNYFNCGHNTLGELFKTATKQILFNTAQSKQSKHKVHCPSSRAQAMIF